MDEHHNPPFHPQDSHTSPYYIEEDTISLSDILLVLAKQLKLLIIAPLVLGTITAFYVLFISQPVYVSSTKIMSSGGSGSSPQLQGLVAQFGVTIPGGNESPEWVYPDIIRSRTLANALFDRKFDSEEFGPQKTLLQILTYGDEEPAFGPDTLKKIAFEEYNGMIGVDQDPITQIYTVTVSASEPKLAADICEALIEELDEHQRGYKTEKAKETRIFIEGRIIEVQRELEEAEEDLKDFIDRNRQIQSSPALLLERERLTRESSVLTGVFTTLKQQLEMSKIDEVKESALVQVLDPPEAPLYRDKPKRKLAVLISLILGLGMAIVVAFIREYAKNSDEEEKGKLRQVSDLIRSTIFDLIPFKKKKRF